ncbi:MAG: FAD-dependent monooxygenase [Bacteroidetes bacterium]|nr:FAD-dependent monooxygenase [Bacteroidota bacterium]
MNNKQLYDCAIIGGGLGGLTLAINLSRQGYSVVLFEKEQYPFHKVCGEYISMESWPYLESLGLPLSSMNLPVIKKLIVTSPDGNTLSQELPLGGFGISRNLIDYSLMKIAKEAGVTVMEHCKAEDIAFSGDIFSIQTSKGNFSSKVCCGAFGKRSNIDVKWKRNFVQQTPNKLNNFIAVKYHIQSSFPADSIALHNFHNGYCGISRIEDGKYCLCYLTNAANLKASGNSIDEMEKNILSKNPHLQKIFQQSVKLFHEPLSISHISFQEKKVVEQHVLMIGDSAGSIPPLCGNGMSMAMHAGKIAAGYIVDFVQNRISRTEMEKRYTANWKKMFGRRLFTGRIIQRLFGKSKTTNLFIRMMKSLPGLTRYIIKQTHGKEY